MNTFAYDGPNDASADHDAAQQQLPGRPRRRLLTKGSATLLCLLLGGVGFLVGIDVERGQKSTSSSAAAPSSAGAPGRSAAPRGAAGGTGSAGGTAGTVSSVSGTKVDLKSASGDTVKVRLSSATKLSKNLTVSRGSLRPGDTIVVTGVSGSDGTIKAATITDSGANS
jgi:hypothetical protein